MPAATNDPLQVLPATPPPSTLPAMSKAVFAFMVAGQAPAKVAIMNTFVFGPGNLVVTVPVNVPFVRGSELLATEIVPVIVPP